VRDVADLKHHEALSSQTMTTVQEAALRAVTCLLPTEPFPSTQLVPLVLKELARYAALGCDPPPPPPASADGSSRGKVRQGACVPLALAAMDELSRIYTRYCDLQASVPSHLLALICGAASVAAGAAACAAAAVVANAGVLL
jgi:hypothetical protein